MIREEIIPHEEYEIAARYAKALQQIASQRDIIYQVETELKMFLSILEKQKALDKILNHPVIGLEQKEGLLGAILKEGYMSDITKNFIRLLVEERRLDILKYIIAVYRVITFLLERKARASVFSASKLSKELQEKLTGYLCKRMCKDIELDIAIDKSMISGLMVMAGGKLYDGSIRKRLKLLREGLS